MFGIFKKKREAAPPTQVRPTVRSAPLPEEVLTFLRKREDFNESMLRINVLDEQECTVATDQLQGISTAERLGLIVLDDANDSNPYCYITRGIAAGMVVHFNHDPEPTIEFASLSEFEHFLRGLKLEHKELGEDLLQAPAHPKQEALAQAILELALLEDDEDAEFLICLYLPLLRGRHPNVLEEIATHPSFLVREALANACGGARLPGSEIILQKLMADAHIQVRNAAGRAEKQLVVAQRDTSPSA